VHRRKLLKIRSTPYPWRNGAEGSAEPEDAADDEMDEWDDDEANTSGDDE